MLKLVVNPNIDLSVLERMGFEKRYSELTGELIYYIDAENNIVIYLEPKSLEIGNNEYSYQKEKQVIKLMRLFSEEILLLEEENINTENEIIEGNE